MYVLNKKTFFSKKNHHTTIIPEKLTIILQFHHLTFSPYLDSSLVLTIAFRSGTFFKQFPYVARVLQVSLNQS